MIKIFKFFIFLMLFTGFTVINAQVFITELADPNNDALSRYIELYNAGTTAVDFTEGSNWRIDKYTNASATVSQTLNLTGTIPAGGFYIIATGPVDGDFLTMYGVNADQFDGAVDNVAGSNGDDNLELYDGNGTLVDQFGVPGEDGTGTTHEFEDGRAERVATVTSGKAVWDIAEWNIWNDGPTVAGTTNAPQDAPGAFDPRTWIGVGGFEVDPLPTVSTMPNPADVAVELALSVDMKVSLGWEYNHNESFTDPDSFKVLIDEDVNFGSPELFKVAYVSGNNNYYSSIELGVAYLTTYYWKVIPFNTNGEAIEPITWSFTTVNAPGGLPNIFFSEYIEGSSNNKGLEVFNGGDTEVDLTQFVILQGVNGGYWSSAHTFPAGAKLAAGDVWVMVADQVNPALYDTSKANEVIAYSSSSPVHFNGDDARALAMIVGTDTTLIDVIGLVNGIDPGTAWPVAGIANATANHTLVRKDAITSGNVNWITSAGTLIEDSEWIVYDIDNFDYIGLHPGTNVVPPTPNLFFSEYIEGSSNNKAIEIYNANGSDVDLSTIRVIRANNGAVALSDSLVLSGTLVAGDVFVIGNSSAVQAILDVSDITSTLTYFNGDDFMGLQFNKAGIWETIDVVGLLGEDPGAGWKVSGVADATANHTLVRKETVTIGNTDWAVSGDTTAGSSEWIIYDNDVLDYLGQHPGGNIVITEPLIAAPTPMVDSTNVISLFSNAYTNVVVDTWSTSWDVADVSDVQIVGNDTKLYTNIVYAGIETVSQVIDASAMTHFHMDIWTPDSTDDLAVFKIKLVDFGADGAWSGGDDVEYEITLSAATTPAISTGEWVSLNIPLSEFTGLTTTEHMAQYIISGDLKTVYVDNMYFYKAPNPILFSNYEAGLGDWTPISAASTNVWVQATGTGANGTSGFAQMNGYQEDVISNDYLIAGPFNFNNFSSEYMEFWSAAKYGNFNTELTLEYSTNYDGSADPSAFTWNTLTFNRPSDNLDTWTNSGKVLLSDINSDVVYIAFHYLSDGTKGRWKIDEVGIYGVAEQGIDLPPVIESVNRYVLVPDANQNTEVSATVTDDKAVASVNLVYSNDGNIFNVVSMTNTSGNLWEGSVPETLYSDGNLFGYYIVAQDNIGQTDSSTIVMLFAGNTPIENIKLLNEEGLLQFTGLVARITGTVSAGSGTYSTGRIEAYMQDETAGVLVYKSGTETPLMIENNSYTVTGKVIQYNGLIEIEPINAATDIIDNGAVTPLVPKLVTINEIKLNPELLESQLVSIKGAELSSSTAWLAGSTSGSTMKIYTNTDTLDLRVDADTDIWGAASPQFPQDITGILGQYDSSTPFYSGYQLMPRRLTDFETAVSVDDQNGIPIVYALNQNYPNPFNPSTRIQFSIPENGMVTLKVFDILGREVMTLINEELPASYQTIEFDASQLTSGIYFYRLQVNNFNSVKKMILMK